MLHMKKKHSCRPDETNNFVVPFQPQPRLQRRTHRGSTSPAAFTPSAPSKSGGYFNPNSVWISHASLDSGSTFRSCSTFILPAHHHQHMVHSERYGRDLNGYHQFMLACKLYFSEYLEKMVAHKVTFIIQHLMGQANDWAVAILEGDRRLTSSNEEFLLRFWAVFDHPDQGQTKSQQLLSLQ